MKNKLLLEGHNQDYFEYKLSVLKTKIETNINCVNQFLHLRKNCLKNIYFRRSEMKAGRKKKLIKY